MFNAIEITDASLIDHNFTTLGPLQDSIAKGKKYQKQKI